MVQINSCVRLDYTQVYVNPSEYFPVFPTPRLDELKFPKHFLKHRKTIKGS